jgi:hypothetical protein
VRRVEREDAAVPVPLAEEREQAHELDEPLVRLERRVAGRELVGCSPEVRLGHFVPGVWMHSLERFEENPDVACPLRRRRRGRSARLAGGASRQKER